MHGPLFGARPRTARCMGPLSKIDAPLLEPSAAVSLFKDSQERTLERRHSGTLVAYQLEVRNNPVACGQEERPAKSHRFHLQPQIESCLFSPIGQAPGILQPQKSICKRNFRAKFPEHTSNLSGSSLVICLQFQSDQELRSTRSMAEEKPNVEHINLKVVDTVSGPNLRKELKFSSKSKGTHP